MPTSAISPPSTAARPAGHLGPAARAAIIGSVRLRPTCRAFEIIGVKEVRVFDPIGVIHGWPLAPATLAPRLRAVYCVGANLDKFVTRGESVFILKNTSVQHFKISNIVTLSKKQEIFFSKCQNNCCWHYISINIFVSGIPLASFPIKNI